ncbi:MAG: MBL fold metallo-hydrolase [Thioalkalivibrio sp.]|nr:MBL fold metallo-hydrolase [Thioalkalivibrio sp.]
MLLKHYFVEKIAHSSYILAGQDHCAVIDPQRDVEVYIAEARAMGVTITHILQTHLHADFISGHMDLAKQTGAKIYIAKSARCTYDHVGLVEGDTIELEDMLLQVLETPGHTPEHLSYVVIDKSRSDSPLGVFVGDTLFVGDVGRPDLFPDLADELARKLYHSLHDKLLKLPDHVEVWPAHGAGSLCGRAMGAKWRTTIGYERNYNPPLQIGDETAFVKSLTEDMPEAPDHFSRCSDINRQGPALVADLPTMEELGPDRFKERMGAADIELLDARGYHAFAAQHIPTTWDRRVGVDRIVGYLDGSMVAWAVAGLKSSHIELASAEDLHAMVTGTSGFVLLDVRAPLEYADTHIKGAVNIPVADLRTRHTELNKDDAFVLICSSGNRSTLGASILKQHGFNEVTNVAGGMTGYSAAGYIRECRACVNPHGSRFFTGLSKVDRHPDTQ